MALLFQGSELFRENLALPLDNFWDFDIILLIVISGRGKVDKLFLSRNH